MKRSYYLVIFTFFFLFSSISYAEASENTSSQQYTNTNSSSYSRVESPNLSFSPDEIVASAVLTKNYIESNKKLPNRVKIRTSYVNMAQLLHLMTTATIQKSEDHNQNILLKSDIPPQTVEENITRGSLSRTEYLDFAKRLMDYMNINNQAPAYGLIGMGKVSYQSQIYLFTRILYQYGLKEEIPTYMNIKAWNPQNIPTKDNPQAQLNPQKIAASASYLKNYVLKYKKPPLTLTVDGIYVNLAQYLALATGATIQISKKNYSNQILKTYSLPFTSRENLKSGRLTKTAYLDFANRIKKYMNTMQQAPPYGVIGQGMASYESMSYIYSNILDFYHLKGVIPSYQDISPLFLTAFTMEIVVGETGGDVTKNQVLFANLKKNLVNQKVTDAARQGTVMVRFGNGGGPRVMIVAGVHGNELPSQIMAMRLINELNGKKIRGTVYIIPFAAPWAVEKNDRLYKWINLNRVSNNNGTPTNTIAKLAKKLNIKYFGDFHCTQPGGSPGINCILYYPGSKNMGRHIQSHSGGSLINVLQYAGLLTTVTSNLGITSIICEAQSPHGTVQPGSLGIQYKFQKAFLNYAGII